MTRLWSIQDTIQQVAEAIASALGISVEIVDDDLTIVGGTGEYRKDVGTKVEAGYTYSEVLRTGRRFIISDPASDPGYDPSSRAGRTREKAEICCPIRFRAGVIGVLGLVAFNADQRTILLSAPENWLTFIERMADLIAGKVAEVETLDRLEVAGKELRAVLDSIQEGIIATDREGRVTEVNVGAEALLGRGRGEIVGRPLAEQFPLSAVAEVLNGGPPVDSREETVVTPTGPVHLVTTVEPIKIGDEVLGAVASLRDAAAVHRTLSRLTARSQGYLFSDIIGTSPALQAVKEQASRVALSNSTVLIYGESGTGKELFARAIHTASPRRDGPLVSINCAAIPESLLESELFGYETGAFTGASRGGKAGKFELAEGGTIFLDEVGDLPLHLQVKLLRVLQERTVERIGGLRPTPVDVRVIAATNKDLDKMVREGGFRDDLFYRLNVIPLTIPPLRERTSDIVPLLDYFLRKYNRLLDKRIRGLSEVTIRVLLRYPWPGNVRELENVVEYAVNMEGHSVILPESLPPRFRLDPAERIHCPSALKSLLAAREREIVAETIRLCGRNAQGYERAAKMLGISRASLYRKLKRLDAPNGGPAAGPDQLRKS